MKFSATFPIYYFWVFYIFQLFFQWLCGPLFNSNFKKCIQGATVDNNDLNYHFSTGHITIRASISVFEYCYLVECLQ